MNIHTIKGREILDSRGNPTVEVELVLESGIAVTAAVPSGASKGIHEARELRDGDKHRYKGKGVLKAIKNIDEIIFPALRGMNALDQKKIDETMIHLDQERDKKLNKIKKNHENKKENLGANAILGVSMAVAKAAASFCGLPLYRYLGGVGAVELPVPMLNIINGGEHADNNVDLQEFMIVPVGAPNLKEALRISSEIFHTLKGILKKKGYSTTVGDEGGFAPNLKSNEEAVDVILEAIEKAHYKTGKDKDVCLALDAAASAFFEDSKYVFKWSGGGTFSSDELVEFYVKLVKDHSMIISIEDGLAEDDCDVLNKMNEKLGNKIQLVGDDLFVTNPVRFQEGLDKGICNSILIKLNQIGTVTETIETIQMAQRNKYTAVVSHRSGETEDTFIADFAVGLCTGQIKTGSVSRSERIAKYNQLLRIEEELGDAAVYKGIKTFYNL